MHPDIPQPSPDARPEAAPPPAPEPNPVARRAPETVSLRREVRGQREALSETVTDGRIRAANDVVTLPLDQVTQDAFTPDVTLADLQGALKDKQWGKVLQCAVKLLFSKKNEVKDLGFATDALTQSLARATPTQLAGILRQAERLGGSEQRSMDWRTKIKLGIVRGETELVLMRRGYTRERVATAAGRPIPIAEGDTLPRLVERGAIKREVWDAIQKGLRDEPGGVVGPLSTEAPLPGGSYLYLDAQGFPIALARTQGESPSVALLRKTAPENPAATKVDLLEQRLQPGQIIMTNVAYGQRDAQSRGYATLGRMFQATSPDDESFFAVHPMIVQERDAQGRIILMDLMPGGVRRVALRDVMGPGKRIGSVSVCSLPDPAAGARLIEQAARLSATYKYSFARAQRLGVSRFRQMSGRGDDGGTAIPLDDKGVCVDFIRKAALDAGIPALADATSALQMFQRLNVEYALEL